MATSELDELATTGTGFLADLCRAWEAATEPASAAGISVAHLRSGMVLSSDGGVLAKQLPLFKFGLGGRFGSGDQWQSWISIDDEVGAIEHLLTAGVVGPVNLTAPAPVTNCGIHRPARSRAAPPSPAADPEHRSRRRCTDVSSSRTCCSPARRVVPGALLESGFVFRHPDLEDALRQLLGR